MVSFTYNSDGTLATKTDARGQQIAYTYDTFKRVTQIKRYDTGGGLVPSQGTTFTYDVGTNAWGRLGSSAYTVNGVSSSESYGYTVAGLVTAKTLTMGTRSLTANYTYDNEGKPTSVKYPDTQIWNGSGLSTVTGATYNLTYDTMSRPSGMTQQGGGTLVQRVVYNAANQMTQLWFNGYTEARTYNNRLQMTQLTATIGATTSLSMGYAYSATQNNGQITSQTDGVSGEQVVYAYDSLNRLVSASTVGPQWGLSFSYDGFGNKLSQTITKGNAPPSSVTVDGLTNRISGYGYDNNGNTTSTPLLGAISYDIENRITTVLGETYGYAPDNKRIYKLRPGVEEVFYFGVGGQRLGVYTPKTNGSSQYFELKTSWQYFAGRRLQVMDRLGSVPTPGSRYYPYGEESNPPANNADKFATYYRDGTGLDYASQRYYASTLGRFLTADPYQASGGPSQPGSWNRYTYVKGDPINYRDPSGRIEACPEGTHTGPDGKSCVKENSEDSICPLCPTIPIGEYPQGQGGGIHEGGQTIRDVTGQAEDSVEWRRVRDSINGLHDALRGEDGADCRRWLEDGLRRSPVGRQIGSLDEYLNQLPWAAGVATITPDRDASRVNAIASNRVAGYLVLFERTGYFFGQPSGNTQIGPSDRFTPWISRIRGGTEQAQEFIILHELGHLLQTRGFQNDINSGRAQANNNDLVWQNCSGLLSRNR